MPSQWQWQTPTAVLPSKHPVKWTLGVDPNAHTSITIEDGKISVSYTPQEVMQPSDKLILED
jgi:hypothetical protein